ncbi:unnamed protein product [Lampetra planeri]
MSRPQQALCKAEPPALSSCIVSSGVGAATSRVAIQPRFVCQFSHVVACLENFWLPAALSVDTPSRHGGSLAVDNVTSTAGTSDKAELGIRDGGGY